MPRAGFEPQSLGVAGSNGDHFTMPLPQVLNALLFLNWMRFKLSVINTAHLMYFGTFFETKAHTYLLKSKTVKKTFKAYNKTGSQHFKILVLKFSIFAMLHHQAILFSS